MRKKNGITLIALVITIIVLLILAGVSINLTFGNNGLITQARSARLATRFGKYNEELNLYLSEKSSENVEFQVESLSAGKNSLYYNTQKENEKGNIKNIISDIDEEYLELLQVIKGQLIVRTTEKSVIKAAQIVGIQANPYDITENGELESSNGNLALMDKDGTLVLPDIVTSIGSGAFSGLEGLKTIIIPESVTEIKSNAFSNNKDLEKVVIKGNLEKIEDVAFMNCTNLKQINLPDSLNYLGTYAFAGTALTDIRIPKSLKTIGAAAFAWTKVKNVELQEGMESIGGYAFNSCQLESIKIPSTVISISETSFYCCNNLITIDVTSNTNFVFENGCLLNKGRDQILFISKSVLTNTDTFSIPEGIKSFSTGITNYSNITKIAIPASLETIDVAKLPTTINEFEINSENTNLLLGNKILYNKDNELLACFSKEKNIEIQEGIEKITNSVFKFAINAENINLPNSLTIINGSIVEGLKNIKNINIGENVSYISPFAFPHVGCNVNINNENYVVENNILYKKNNGKKECLVSVLYYIDGTIDIDEEVKEIGVYAFYEQRYLTYIKIPDGIENILTYAFSSCIKLNKIEIPKTVKTIGKGAFAGDILLEEVIINNKADSIEGAPWDAEKGMKVIKWLE